MTENIDPTTERPAVQPVAEQPVAAPAPAAPATVTISKRALWSVVGVVAALFIVAGTFASGVVVGSHLGGPDRRGAEFAVAQRIGGQQPGGPGFGQQGQMPPGGRGFGGRQSQQPGGPGMGQQGQMPGGPRGDLDGDGPRGLGGQGFGGQQPTQAPVPAP